MKIVSTILTFSQVKKEILKVAPLEVDQGDPHTGGLGVLMTYDLYSYFYCNIKVFLRQSCISFHVLALCPLDHVKTLTKTSLEFT